MIVFLGDIDGFCDRRQGEKKLEMRKNKRNVDNAYEVWEDEEEHKRGITACRKLNSSA